VKIQYQPGAPSLPFPTAFPSFGVYLQNPISGAHESNPTALRILTIRPRGVYTAPHSYNTYWLQALSTNPYLNPTTRQYDNLIQTWLTKYWLDSLTALQRGAWQTLASSRTVTNTFGTAHYLSGFGFFLRANRLYLTQLAFWNGRTAPTGKPFFTTAPAAWASITPLAITNTTFYYLTPALMHTLTGQIVVAGLINLYTSNRTHRVICYASHPGRTLSARRQGPMTQIASFPPPALRPSTQYATSVIVPPDCAVGDNITLQFLTIDTTTPGESASTWVTLPLTAGPLP
jgi:hypothetical protein